MSATVLWLGIALQVWIVPSVLFMTQAHNQFKREEL